MRKLAAFIVSSRLAAAACCAGFAALANLFPPSFILANAGVVLHALCRGVRSSLPMVLAAALLLSLWFVFLHQMVQSSGSFVQAYRDVLLVIFTLWLPFLALAWILRTSNSLSLVFQIMAVLGALGVLVMAWLIENPAAFWDAVFAAMVQDEIMQAVRTDAEMKQNYQSFLSIAAVALTAGVLLFVLLSMLLGRWWQSLLYNSGGFRGEFLGLQLGRPYAATALALLLLTLTFEYAMFRDLCIVLMVPLLFQGVATMHFFLGAAKRPEVWLSLFYVSLGLAFLVFPFILQVLSLLAIAEALFNLRSKALTVR